MVMIMMMMNQFLNFICIPTVQINFISHSLGLHSLVSRALQGPMGPVESR